MHGLFENFVRNFAIRHCQEAKVSAMTIQWQSDESAHAMLPRMVTDVTMQWPGRKLIIDCKYYEDALVTRYNGARFRSNHLYQLHSYLTNKAADPGWENVEGMLLYPSNGRSLHEKFSLYDRHQITIASIDLGQNWSNIERDLQTLLQKS